MVDADALLRISISDWAKSLSEVVLVAGTDATFCCSGASKFQYLPPGSWSLACLYKISSIPPKHSFSAIWVNVSSIGFSEGAIKDSYKSSLFILTSASLKSLSPDITGLASRANLCN